MPFNKASLAPEAAATPGPGAVAQLADAAPDQRRRAAQALAGVAEALEPLAARLPVEPDAAVRDALFDALARIESAAAAEALIPLLASETADLRLGAVAALRRLSRFVAPRIEALLTDPDPDVRLMALDILSALPAPAPVSGLGLVLARETDVNVIVTALDRAAIFGAPDLVPAITAIRARHGDQDFVAFCCDHALDAIARAWP